MYNSFRKTAEKASLASLCGTLVGTILTFFAEALLLIWIFNILLPIFPALACLAGLTYWDWVGLAVGWEIFCRCVERFFKAVWVK